MVRSDAAIANAIDKVGNVLNGAMNSNQGSEDAVVAMCAWRELKAAVKAQHDALDMLFALLISRSPPGDMFYPSKSGEPWEALMQGKAALELANGERIAKDA